MLKIPFILIIILIFFSVSFKANGQAKASDFFKGLSKEKNLIEALYSANRKTPKKEIVPFTLAGEAGLLTTSGNTDTSIIKLAFESNHELPDWSNRYETRFLQRVNTLNNTDTKVETTRVEISAQFDYKLLQPSNRLFAYVEYDDNQFNRLRDQSSVVVGWSQVAWKQEQSELRYSIGPGYSRFVQERDDITIEELIVRGTVFYNYTFSENTRFRQSISAEMGEIITKAKSQSSITAKVFEKLAMKLSINVVFNDNVAEQDSNVSTETSVSMVYQFF